MSDACPPASTAEAVARFFAEHVAGGDVPLEFSLISGGRSNLTYRVEGGGRAAGCCAGRRSGTCCRPRTTWRASIAC